MFAQTVSLYRKDAAVRRLVLDGCHYEWRVEQVTDEWGTRQETKCLLLLPGEADVRPGDRVYDGIGPEAAEVDWAAFLPVRVPGLAELEYVQPRKRNGEVVHTEAGRR